MPRTISLLDQATIPQPCPVAWRTMRGRDERVRFCSQCAKHVHNLSAMSREEAEELLLHRADLDDELCVQMKRRHDGSVITRDGLRTHRWWRIIAAVIAAGFSLFGCGCGSGGMVVAGSIARPVPPATQPDQPAP